MSRYYRGAAAAHGAALTLLVAAAAATAAEPQALIEGAWVCSTRAAFEQATNGGWKGARFDIDKYRNGTLEPELCLFVDDDVIEDTMAPFVTVLEQDGNRVKVTFVVEYYKRIAFLHRKFDRVTFVGWTSASSVEPYYK